MLKTRTSRRSINLSRTTIPNNHATTVNRIKHALLLGVCVWLIICVICYLSFQQPLSSPEPPALPLPHAATDIKARDTPTKPQPATSLSFGYPSKLDMPNPCIVILTYNRPNELLRTVTSLLSVPGVDAYQVYISQDGNIGVTTTMIRDTLHAIPVHSNHTLMTTTIRHLQHSQAAHVWEPTQKLAIHYKFMFNVIFNELRHSHAIVLEDDMIFSRDFLEYFAGTVSLLNDARNALFCVSSWNDYGLSSLAHDAQRVYRTDYFPGLGWLLRREFWWEIADLFPEDHWDHFMRMDTVTQGRECLFPGVSRNYNIGERGSTMDEAWYNQYLRPMQFEPLSNVSFTQLDLSYLQVDAYETWMADLVAKAQFVGVFPTHAALIYEQWNAPDMERFGRFLLIAYHGYEWNAIAHKMNVLGIARTTHKHTILIENSEGFTFIFANIRLSPYLRQNQEFQQLLPSLKLKNENMVIITGEIGRSCYDVCRAENNKACLHDHFEYVNRCSVLQAHFGCEAGCMGGVVGEDVPNYVAKQKPVLYQKCLTSNMQPTCLASHPTTMRICPCA